MLAENIKLLYEVPPGNNLDALTIFARKDMPQSLLLSLCICLRDLTMLTFFAYHHYVKIDFHWRNALAFILSHKYILSFINISVNLEIYFPSENRISHILILELWKNICENRKYDCLHIKHTSTYHLNEW